MKATSMAVLQCVECFGKYSAEDVKQGLFFATTMVCKECYLARQNQPHSLSCFGKTTLAKNGRIVGLGYDISAPECSGECPDRFICRAFLSSKGKAE